MRLESIANSWMNCIFASEADQYPCLQLQLIFLFSQKNIAVQQNWKTLRHTFWIRGDFGCGRLFGYSLCDELQRI